MATCRDPSENLLRLRDPFTSGDALRAGISPWNLRQLVLAGQVRPVLRGVYARSDVADTIPLRAAALGAVVPRHAVICDRTAAWLWGVDVLRPWELEQLPRLETFVLRGHARIRRPQAGGGERDLLPGEVVEIDGVCVTTPLRTSLDLGCGLSRYEALAAMDGFARVQGVGCVALTAMLPRFRGRRGVVQARELVPLVDGRAESTGESFTRAAIHDDGLPRPTPQFWVETEGSAAYRLDLAYPQLKICIEYDGQRYHSSDAARERDDKRRQWLREHGWVVIVVTKDDLSGPARDRWLAELRLAIAERMR